MYVLKIKSILIYLSIFVIAIFGGIIYCNSAEKVETISNTFSKRIVIDAGHGLPDGGATGNGIIESDLNLAIAKKLQEELCLLDYDIIMTRENSNNIADIDKQKSISQTKNSDLNNRVKIINESNADFCISIHLNKYSAEKYWGWQTFYSESSEAGKVLATNIQNSIKNKVARENKREPLTISNIKIVDKTNIPVVIVECGFISNIEEANLLRQEDYQQKIVERNM